MAGAATRKAAAALGKVGEAIAAEQAVAHKEIDDLYAEDPTPETAVETPEPVVPEASPEAAATPPTDPLVASPLPEAAAPPPASEPPPALDPVAENQKEALRIERELRRKEKEQFEANQKLQQEQFAALQRELAALKTKQQQFDDLLTPEKTEEEKQQEATEAWVRQQAEAVIQPLKQSYEQQMAQMRLALSVQQAIAAHPADYQKLTGWTGNPNELIDGQHPFGQYLATSPMLRDAIAAAPNVGEAIYQAARDFSLSRPGGMQVELAEREKGLRAQIQAEVEAKYKDLLSKAGESPAAQSGSIMAMPGAGPGTAKSISDDDFDPYNMTPEKRELFNSGFAEIYGA